MYVSWSGFLNSTTFVLFEMMVRLLFGACSWPPCSILVMFWSSDSKDYVISISQIPHITLFSWWQLVLPHHDVGGHRPAASSLPAILFSRFAYLFCFCLLYLLRTMFDIVQLPSYTNSWFWFKIACFVLITMFSYSLCSRTHIFFSP